MALFDWDTDYSLNYQLKMPCSTFATFLQSEEIAKMILIAIQDINSRPQTFELSIVTHFIFVINCQWIVSSVYSCAGKMCVQLKLHCFASQHLLSKESFGGLRKLMIIFIDFLNTIYSETFEVTLHKTPKIFITQKINAATSICNI